MAMAIGVMWLSMLVITIPYFDANTKFVNYIFQVPNDNLENNNIIVVLCVPMLLDTVQLLRVYLFTNEV